MLLDFAQTINDDMSNFDEEAAWPLMIDEVCWHCFEIFEIFV